MDAGELLAVAGRVVRGPARSARKSYDTSYDGSGSVSVAFPNLGYSVATEFVEAGAGGRVKLEFETLSGMDYSVQVRGTVNGGESAKAKFSLSPGGSPNKTSIGGNGGGQPRYRDHDSSSAKHTNQRPGRQDCRSDSGQTKCPQVHP